MLGTTGGPIPSTGLGNIGSVFGPANSPGAAGAPARPMQPFGPIGDPVQGRPISSMQGGTASLNYQQTPTGIGNPLGIMSQTPSASQPSPQGPGFHQTLSQMDPKHVAALRGIPQQAMMRLHSAGLIHPALMQHLYGAQT